MPFKSKKQERLFQAAAHSPEFGKKVGLSQATAKKYIADTKRKKGKKK